MSACVGLYGGTFNPIHFGHLRAAQDVVEALELERMLFIPSATPPHKCSAGDDIIAPAPQRLAWTRLAVQDNPRFAVDACEVEREGRSYSVETLRELARRPGATPPVFTIGCDAFAELGSWKDPAALLGMAHFAVTTRPPVRAGSLREWLPECLRDEVELTADGLSGRHRRAGTWIRALPVTYLDISASDVRRRIREGRSTRYLLPDAVRQAVEDSGVYRGATAGEARA